MAGTAEKIYSDPEIGEVVLRKSVRARRISIRVHPLRGVCVTVPYRVPYAVASGFLKLKRSWVLDVMERQRRKVSDIPAAAPEDIEVLRRQAKAELPGRLAELARRYGFVYNRVTVKHNSSNWGSCSVRNNINLNLNIVRLPRVLQDYVLLHELCHLRHHDHGQAFHLLLEHVLTDNLLKLIDKGDGLASELAGKAAVSKARYPVDHVLSKNVAGYRLV